MLEKVIESRNLDFESAYDLFNSLLSDNGIRAGAILAALEAKGYSGEVVAGFARAMIDNAVKIDLGEVIDTCGTGGDGARTINVSTATSIIMSNFTRVAKHGNRSITSNSGSADVLESLRIDVKLDAVRASHLLEKTNFTFLFAPLYHTALAKLMPVRRELGIRTIINVAAPLANPARPKYQLVGVSRESLVDIVAQALHILNVKRAVVVHGNGMDEVSPSGTTTVGIVDGGIDKFRVNPSDFGLKEVKVIPCYGPAESAARIEAVLSGKGSLEDRNFILINTAMAIYASGTEDLIECREMAEHGIEKGLKKLEEIRNVCPKT
jgi:anthranilate phosphoribosyltransferase